MLARTKICLIRTYSFSFRWISKEIASIKPNEIAKFIGSTDNLQDTLNLNWHEMNDSHKQYFQNRLKQNEPITFISESKHNKNANKKKQENKNDEPYIDHIILRDMNDLNKNDALNMVEWLNTILSSPNNAIKHLNFDLSESNNNNNTNEQIIDSQCINVLCEGIQKNPNKTIDLESLEFNSISMSKTDVEYIFNAIKLKCKYCEYLSLENCILNGNEIVDTIYNFYYDNDYYGLRNTSLNEINLYDTKFEFTYFFHNHALVVLNRNIKKFLRLAIKSYGDYLRIESILIHTNNPYFRYCILPNLRMTLGTISREYSSYYRDIVRYNRSNFDEETIKSMRKMGIVIWFALMSGLLVSNIIRRGKESWWFKIAEFIGLDSVKKKKRDPYNTKKKKKKTWTQRIFG